MEHTLLSIALILVLSKLGGALCKKIGMPEILGALVAGVLLGPAVTGLVRADEGINLLSELGVIFLMFLAGLETDLKQMKSAGKASLLVALFGIALPLAAGTAGAYLFYGDLRENLFIGLILTATSVSVTVETLNELGKLGTRVGASILGAAVLDDLLGLILISAFVAQGNGGGASLAVTVGSVLLFCLAAVLAVAFLPKLLRPLTRRFAPGRTVLGLALAASLLASFAAEGLGVAAITGAYLCGLLFSRLPYREYLSKNVHLLSSGFFAPVFFASVGLTAGLSGSGFRTLAIAAVLFVIALLGKLLGCGAAARLSGMSRSEALQVGAGMVARGEVAVITANIGLQSRLISEEVFLPTILVTVLTTVVTPILLKLAFSRKLSRRLDGKRREEAQASEPALRPPL